GTSNGQFAIVGSQFMKQFRPSPSETGGMLIKLIVSLFLLTFFLGLYFVRHPIFRFAAKSWVIEDPLEKADILMILNNDNFYANRATRTAKLFKKKKTPLMIANKQKLRPSTGITELMEHDLVERGVPKNKILRF